MTKECECMAYGEYECVCGAWDEPQRTWVGLTEKEQDSIFKTFSRSEAHKLNFLNRVASAVEAKLKQKNGYAEEKKND
jgi:hypothetical protein